MKLFGLLCAVLAACASAGQPGEGADIAGEQRVEGLPVTRACKLQQVRG